MSRQVGVIVPTDETAYPRISYYEAVCIPGVIMWGLCFFCIKFAVYALLLWMPLFLNQELGYSKQQQANVLSLYEVGVVIGAIILGGTSDYFYSRRSLVGMFSIVLSSIFCFIIAFNYKNFSETAFTVLLFFLGFFVGSLHHLIVISASADIGREQIGKRATSTVTGIIDGIGTSGSGVGQVILGKTIQSFGWFYGYILFIAILITMAAVPMSRVLVREINEIRIIRRQKREALQH